jgi:hypothetical protein
LIGIGVLVVFMVVWSATPLRAEEPSSVPAGNSNPQALWEANSLGFAEYSGKQLVVTIFLDTFAPGGLTFDSNDNFWGSFCKNPNGSTNGGLIFELTPPEITDIENGLAVTAAVELQNPKSPPNFDCPSALQFDKAGNLWVANKGADTKKPSIMKYTPDQLMIGGKVSPTFFTSPAIDTIWDMKFDGSGNLWLAADPVPQNINGGIFEIKSSQLSAVGSPVVVTFNQQLTSSALNLPKALAFDSGGNLWTTGNGSTLLLFAAGDLNGSGIVSVNPAVTLSSSKRKNHSYTFFKPSGLAIDGSGNLWVSSPKNGGGPNKQFGSISEFSSSEITTTGSPPSTLSLQGKPVTNHPAVLTAGPLE